MTSPYATGGGGTHLEARIAAASLAAILCEASVRGLPGEFATSVRSQRAKFDDPLDDLIVDGLRTEGRTTQLHLQVKNKITFTANDSDWTDVLERAWDTFSKNSFDPTLHRLGVAIGVYNARADQHYQSVLKWAEHSTDAQHFFERIEQGDYSHQDKRSFVADARSILEAHAKRSLSADELWRFLKSFVIVYYDFQSAESSRDEIYVIERLKGVLTPEHRDQARRIWDHLVAKAGEMIPAGGGATIATLKDALTREGFTIGAAPSLWKDIQLLHRESRRALDDIRSDIHGFRLHRRDAYEGVRDALTDGRLIQIGGEPGTGKSALLKEVAEECERNGPILVLKDARIHPKGWTAHAHAIGVSSDVVALLREFACAGTPILFIDGIDKITDPAVQLTVNDILKAIANNDELAAWTALATIRDQNLTHLETWLDPDALKKLPLRTIAVKPLGREELGVIAKQFSRLRPLLSQPGSADIILKRPFFLNALLGLAGDRASGQLPATEVELMNLWWDMGGADRRDFSPAQHRRNFLINAAEAIARAPNAPIPIRNLPPEPLEDLKSAGVFRDKELGHSIVFAHDIYAEWALCEFLLGQQSAIAQVLQQAGESDVLIRPIQLLGAHALEMNSSSDTWKALLDQTGNGALRPVWQRAVLTSCLQSTRTTQLLQRLTDYMLEDGGERIRRLLLALSTLEVLPNPLFLNEQLIPDLTADERAKYAHLAALPKPLTWVRFLDWLVPHTAELPHTLIPELLAVFKTWQDAYAGQQIRHCREIGAISYEWLKEIEASSHPKRWKDHREPFKGALSGRDIEKATRALFLSSAGEVPELVAEYLSNRSADRKHAHMFRDQILKNSAALARHMPTELVDFILAVYLETPDKRRDPFGSFSRFVFDHLGVAGHSEFYPASPVQMPFLALLRLHEEQGLRLIRRLCNHSIAIWRKAHKHGVRYSGPVTPVPVRLTFPWGKQKFWGDGQVYLWFRGVWGNDAVESALMALEQWALERIDGGAAFDEIFRKVVQGFDAVSTLGIGTSLCLAHEGKALDCAFPLVTCPYIWQWDIARVVQDASPTNQIGNWFQYRTELTAVRTLNQKPHRKKDVRSLVYQFVLSADKALTRKFARSIRRFPDRLPISYREEENDAAHVADLREKMVLFSEQADPRYFKAAQMPDGEHIQVWNEPPSLQKQEYKEQAERRVQLNAYMGVAMWAHKSLEEGKINDQHTLADAVAKVREWDEPDLFDNRSDDFQERHRVSAVAGAAYVAARYASTEEWTADLASWCLSVIERAGSAPNPPGDLHIREAVLLWEPAVFAAHGYSALLARGFETKRCQQALLSLMVDALQGVQVAVMTAARYYAAQQPDFYWILLDLAFQQCVVPRDEIPDHNSIVWDQKESERKLALLDRAESSLAGEGEPTLPTIPMPWVKGETLAPRGRRDTKGYVHNDTVFLYHIADKLLPAIDLKPILANRGRRARFFTLVDGLLAFTFQEIVPPFAKSKRDHDGHTPFEWVFGFAAWLGKLCAHLSRNEVKEHILSLIWARDTETALLILQGVMRNFMIDALLKPSEIGEDHVGLWTDMVDWLFASPEWTHRGRSDHLDREFTSCAFTTLFCVAPDFSPLICGIDPGWPHLQRFLPLFERAIREFGTNVTLYLAVTTFLKRGGFDLLPQPALSWLHDVVVSKKADQKFWKSNGEDTVELLKQLLSQEEKPLTLEHRRLLTSVADMLVDNGVRGAGFLQQELLRVRPG
ncbi:MAG: ATP-binding protein [Xanthobacteraceae bacterium]